MTIRILPGPKLHPEAAFAVITCHHCGRQEQFALNSAIAQAAIAERHAREQGWTLTPAGDYCPAHREYARTQPEET